MEPDRKIERRHPGEKRSELRLIERPSPDVGKDLDSRGPKLGNGAIDLSEGGLGVVHRHRGHETGETIGIFLHQPGHAVVGQARQLRGFLG